MSHRIVVRGANFANKGAEAMLLSIHEACLRSKQSIELFAQLHGEDIVHCANAGPIPLFATKGMNHSRHTAVTDLCFGHKGLDVFQKKYRRIRHSQATQMRRVGPCQVLDASGFAYGDPWSLDNADNAIGWNNFAHKSGHKTVYLPQAWGPFTKPEWIKGLEKLAKDAELYARDSQSQEYLRRALGYDAPLQTDIAFSYSGGSEKRGQELIQELGWKEPTAPLIIMTPNMRLYERCEGRERNNVMLRAMANTAKELVDNTRARVLFLGNEYLPTNSPKGDDRFLCSLLESMCALPGQALALTSWLNTQDVRSILMNAEMIISSRFHSLLLGSTAIKPVLAIGWSHKYQFLLNDIGLSKNLVSGEKGIFSSLAQQSFALWENRSSCKKILENTIPQLRQNARDFLDRIVREACEST